MTRPLDPDPIRLARRIAALVSQGLTQGEAADRVGFRKQKTAAKYLALLALPPIWQERVSSGDLPINQAREIVRAVEYSGALEELDGLWTRAHAVDASHEDELAWPRTAVQLADLVDDLRGTPRRKVQRAPRMDQDRERLCWEIYRSIPRAHWAKLARVGQSKFQHLADQYGVPIGGETVDLAELAQWLHRFLSEYRWVVHSWLKMVALRDRRRNLVGRRNHFHLRKERIAGEWLGQMRQIISCFEDEIQEIESDGTHTQRRAPK
jgi:hypothetical protein